MSVNELNALFESFVDIDQLVAGSNSPRQRKAASRRRAKERTTRMQARAAAAVNRDRDVGAILAAQAEAQARGQAEPAPTAPVPAPTGQAPPRRKTYSVRAALLEAEELARDNMVTVKDVLPHWLVENVAAQLRESKTKMVVTEKLPKSKGHRQNVKSYADLSLPQYEKVHDKLVSFAEHVEFVDTKLKIRYQKNKEYKAKLDAAKYSVMKALAHNPSQPGLRKISIRDRSSGQESKYMLESKPATVAKKKTTMSKTRMVQAAEQALEAIVEEAKAERAAAAAAGGPVPDTTLQRDAAVLEAGAQGLDIKALAAAGCLTRWKDRMMDSIRDAQNKTIYYWTKPTVNLLPVES